MSSKASITVLLGSCGTGNSLLNKTRKDLIFSTCIRSQKKTVFIVLVLLLPDTPSILVSLFEERTVSTYIMLSSGHLAVCGQAGMHVSCGQPTYLLALSAPLRLPLLLFVFPTTDEGIGNLAVQQNLQCDLRPLPLLQDR